MLTIQTLTYDELEALEDGVNFPTDLKLPDPAECEFRVIT